jgi:excisionase family DNA binding protein
VSLIPLSEVARRRGVAYMTVRQWTKDGKLPATRIGNYWFMEEEHALDPITDRRKSPEASARQSAAIRRYLSRRSDSETEIWKRKTREARWGRA